MGIFSEIQGKEITEGSKHMEKTMKFSDFNLEHIRDFWEKHPCGDDFVASHVLHRWKEFFPHYDDFKRKNEPHIFQELEKIDFRGKRVLEIGIGQGTEAQKIIEAGAVYNGIDLSQESVQRVRKRCELYSLPYESLQIMNAEKLDFPDESFDIVFSHGVLHHSPRIKIIVNEIHRVLRREGMVVAMLYHKNSINYQLSIKIIRRLGIFILFIPGMTKLVAKITGEPRDRCERHLVNLKQEGLSYLRMKRFIHKATDGPDNVFSSVFTKSEAAQLFSFFRKLSFSKHFFNERHFPLIRYLLPTKIKNKIATNYGWHLWVKGLK